MSCFGRTGVSAVAMTPQTDPYALSGSVDHTLEVWEVETGCEVATVALDEGIHSVSVARGGDDTLRGTAPAPCTRWDLRSYLILGMNEAALESAVC